MLFDRSKADSPEAPAVILKANTIGSDAEAVPLPFVFLHGQPGGGGGRADEKVLTGGVGAQQFGRDRTGRTSCDSVWLNGCIGPAVNVRLICL